MSAPLDKLHDFYQPAPPAWTPQTIGWCILFALIGVLAIWTAVHLFKKWLANRYRREALHKLVQLSPQQFSELLKRTALTAWPRERVASLSGSAWLEFLNQSAGSGLFRDAPANRIEELAFQSVSLSSEDEQSLRQAVANWIRRHRVQT
jgi:hypothetical protein